MQQSAKGAAAVKPGKRRLISSAQREARIAMLTAELREARDYAAATAEILRVINKTPGDLTPVFDAILEKAHGLCGIAFGSLQLYESGKFRAVAVRAVADSLAEVLRQPIEPLPGTAPSRLLAGERVVQITEIAEWAKQRPDDPRAQATAAHGLQTGLFVPLRKDTDLLGYISALRTEAQPFSDKEIALLENFAAQAVIAMENARLLTETREALEQQTATAEVLGVINASPGDLAPVFDAMLEKATRLCGAQAGFLWTYDGERFQAVAMRGLPPDFAEFVREPRIPGPETGIARLVRGEPLAHFTDVAAIDSYETGDVLHRASVDLGGFRTILVVPLRKEGALLGGFTIERQEVRPFSDKQIALLQNFAAQAVIAMENARLITETRGALEQQTATAEVLGVINSSPGDLAPVFDAMLEKAMILCGATFGELRTYDSERFRLAATQGVPSAYVEYYATHDTGIYGPGTGPARLLAGERIVHVPDLVDTEPYRLGDPDRRALVDLGGARAIVLVPLLKDDAVRGYIMIFRQEPGRFSDKQIALLQNFAAQAVIAMENARLIIETQEALEQQTATAEVLRVISGSATDVQPVFEAIIERAAKLCEAEFSAVARFEDGLLHLVAVSNLLTDEAEAFHSLFPRPPNRGFVMGRAFVESRTVHVEDVLADPDYDIRTREVLQSLTGYRTFLGVPILRDGRPVGVIGCGRRQVRPFTGAQIELVTTFADQAVIAIENARLFNDLRDRTDELTQRQAELRVTFDNMGDGVVMFDEELRLAAWNRNFQHILDLPDALLAEQLSYAEYLHILADRGEFGTEDVEAELNRRLEHTDQEFRSERTRPDGRVIEVRRNAVPGGGFVLIYGDITERKRAEAEIHAARDTAEKALRELQAAQTNLVHAQKMAALGQLTAGIAHEIKNPLNFVNNFAGLSVELLDELKDAAAPMLSSLDEDTRAEIDETVEMLTRNLDKIAEHGKRADNIVKSMLEHSRGVTGERREVDLNGLIDEALNLAYHGARAQDQSFNITLKRELDPELRRMELAPQEMTRVFLNLFGNGFYAASKRQRDGAGPDFRPVLTVTTRDLGETVEVRVRDNGTGIPSEIRDKLFQPFFTTKPTGEGTGLGLSISYDIITQQHGGMIEVDSEPGAFTEFTIRLPR